MGRGKTCTGLYPAAGPEGSSWCRSRSRSGRSKTTMHQVSFIVFEMVVGMSTVGAKLVRLAPRAA